MRRTARRHRPHPLVLALVAALPLALPAAAGAESAGITNLGALGRTKSWAGGGASLSLDATTLGVMPNARLAASRQRVF